VPVFIFSLWAQFKVKSSFSKFSKIGINSGITGAEAARIILEKLGIKDVKIEKTSGWLSDHYSPINKTLKLSSDVYDSNSISAVGVAAHEAGHAIQHFKGMLIMRMWMALAKPATIMSNASVFMIIIGIIFKFFMLAQIGFFFFLIVVLFQIITLPLEFNASNRAKKLLFECGIATNSEISGVNTVLSSAAMTYVAATAAAITQLLYFALILFGGGRRR
jgi:hypothetical protein